MLGLSLHDWETVMIAALAVAGIAAVIVGVSTYCVVQLQRHESAASKRNWCNYREKPRVPMSVQPNWKRTPLA